MVYLSRDEGGESIVLQNESCFSVFKIHSFISFLFSDFTPSREKNMSLEVGGVPKADFFTK